MRDQSVPDKPQQESAHREQRSLGRGSKLAIIGVLLFAGGVAAIGLIGNTYNADGEHWQDLIPVLVLLGALIVGLTFRSRIAWLMSMGAAAAWLIASIPFVVTPRATQGMGWLYVVPPLVVIAGLALAWRSYWRRAG
jgi:hypothetical protein